MGLALFWAQGFTYPDWPRIQSIVEAGLELLSLLLPPPESWDYRHTPEEQHFLLWLSTPAPISPLIVLQWSSATPRSSKPVPYSYIKVRHQALL